ncbi:MAG: VWA domain-containing protein [Verrucomicrobiaceae bacterium]|nr:MAG: VWA domain-containing protein [Verrucomicrobiaceae bacterium]
MRNCPGLSVDRAGDDWHGVRAAPRRAEAAGFMHLTYLQPLWWLLGLLVLGMAWRYSLVDRPKGKMLASLALRALAVIFLVLALCRPGWMREADDLHVVFLVDVSQSVDLKASQEAVAEVEAAVNELKPGDSHSVFAMAKGVRLQPAPDLAKTLESWRTGGVPDDRFRSDSRLAEAMLSTRLAFPAGKSRRLVLLSDGQETRGDVAAALETLRREQVRVEWKPLSGPAEPEASVVSVEPNTSGAFAGEIVRLKVRMASNQPMGARLRILNQGVSMQEKPVALVPGTGNEVVFDMPMTTPGASLWTAELIPDKDHFPLNNQASATVQVKGKSRVLIIHRTPREMRAAARALEEQEFEVDVRGENGVPDTMEGLMAFDAVMRADVPPPPFP